MMAPIPALATGVLLAFCLAAPISLTAVAASAAATATEPGPDVSDGGVFVLGIDGVDPTILQRFMDEGKAPNFSRLAAEGSFAELGTSNPPQSPVAWSNFVTGMNPGGHGIFDFIHRDPATYGPISSATPPLNPDDEPTILEIFGMALPLGGGALENNRSGTPFWDHLHGAGVDVEIYRMPGNFPPTPSEAKTLSGMGTDDLRASNGQYYWFHDNILSNASHLKADTTQVTPEDENDDGFEETIRTFLRGPLDAMRVDPPSEHIELTMMIRISPREDVAWITIGDSQTIVREGEWSEWVDVTFDAMPMGMAPMTGMVRFYAKELKPGFKLYVSPLNFSAEAPATAITTPDDFAPELAGELGHFYTQGMPEETNAYKDGLFDPTDFVKQVRLVHEDGHAMLDLAVERFDAAAGDCTFMYLSDIDLQCHMLWHLEDPKYPDAPPHPAFRASEPGVGEGYLEEFYIGIDNVLGKLREQLPPETLLIVMSDHGFQPFTRKVNLNDWLVQEGYLVLTGDNTTGSMGLVRDPDSGAVDWEHTDIDWRRTKAYGLGFNAIYLNRSGREAEGIVSDADAPGLAAEICQKLAEMVDPKNGRNPVRRAYLGSEIYTGGSSIDRTAEAPDIVVGYDSGYGASEHSTLGEITGDEILYDNLGHDFTGNHLMDPAVVPGILFVNRRLNLDEHDLTDVTASLLAHYGMDAAEGMVGTSFLNN
jgi:predicted AlkP superfamily phosphohydrolase/phosphomutase